MTAAQALARFNTAPRWVAWRNELVAGRLSKRPYSPRAADLKLAETDNPSTWGTLDQAHNLARTLVNGRGGGVGLVLGPLGDDYYIAGIDLDTCLEQGQFTPWANEVIKRCASYAEVSPGGAGAKVFFLFDTKNADTIKRLMGTATGRQWKLGNGKDHPPGIELYISNRYFAVTGRRLEGSPDELRVINLETLRWLITEAGPALAKKGGRKLDRSRSAKAWRIGREMRREGKSFEDFVAALYDDTETAEWAKTKGKANNQRELRRIWDKQDDGAGPVDHIAELNKTFAVIRVVNRVAILNEHLDPEGRPTFSLLSKDSFKLLLANRKATFPGKDNDGKEVETTVPLAGYWINNARRRDYEGITFSPQGTPPGYYNLWTGFAFTRSKKGSCERFKEHLRYNVCDDDAALYSWVFGWFADIFKNPANKCGTALALRGDMGVGKTIVGEVFGRLLGLHYVQVADPRFVSGRFNAHLVRCLLFHCDEAFWAGDRVAEGKVKDLVTGKQHPIELKGCEAFFLPNYVRMFINGNCDWLVPAGAAERRFATLDVADTHKQDIPYFRAMIDELENGGYAKLLDELLGFDLSGVDLRTIPKTAALLDQKFASLPPEAGWWLDILQSGRLPPRPKAVANRCPAKLLYDHYIERATKQGVRRRQIETMLGIFLHKHIPGLQGQIETFVIEACNVWHPATTERGTVYTFPTLEICRAAFSQTLQQYIDWGGPDEWQVC